MAGFAAEVAKQAGKKIVYNNLPESIYQDMLEQIGLPTQLANLVADSDKKAGEGELYTDSRELSHLIGRPTTTLAAAITAALPK